MARADRGWSDFCKKQDVIVHVSLVYRGHPYAPSLLPVPFPLGRYIYGCDAATPPCDDVGRDVADVPYGVVFDALAAAYEVVVDAPALAPYDGLCVGGGR